MRPSAPFRVNGHASDDGSSAGSGQAAQPFQTMLPAQTQSPPQQMIMDLAQHHFRLAQQLLIPPQKLGAHLQVESHIPFAQQLQLLHPGLPLQVSLQQQLPPTVQDQPQVLLDWNLMVDAQSVAAVTSGSFATGFPHPPPSANSLPAFAYSSSIRNTKRCTAGSTLDTSAAPVVAHTASARTARYSALDLLAAVSEAAAKEFDKDTGEQQRSSPSPPVVLSDAPEQSQQQSRQQAQQFVSLLQQQLAQSS